MNQTTIVLVIGLFSGGGMVAWAMSGAFTGKILTKSYGTEDGTRRYARYVFRTEEPAWFWALCATYATVGIAILVIVIRLLMR